MSPDPIGFVKAADIMRESLREGDGRADSRLCVMLVVRILFVNPKE